MSKTSDSMDGNQPMKVEICINDATPSITQRVTLTVTADDPDAPIGKGECDINVSWEGDAGSLCRDVLIPPGPNNPERVPTKGHVVATYDHVYTEGGAKTIDVAVWSGPGDGHPDPYDNYVGLQLPINVK